MVALEAGSALESGAGFLHSQPARQAKGAFDAETEERPRNVAQHWLTGWLCYIGLFNAVLSVAMYLSTLPQYVTLQSLAAGEATFLAVLAQLTGYPFVVALVAVKAQLLMNIMLEALTNPGDRRTILEGTAEILQSAFKLEDTDKVRILLQFGAFIGMGGGLAYGIVLDWSGSNFGIVTGFLYGCLIFTSLIAYAHLVAMIVESYRRCTEESGCGYKGLAEQDGASLFIEGSMKHMRKMVMMGSGYLLLVLVLQILVGFLVWCDILSSKMLILSTAFGIIFCAMAFNYIFSDIMITRPLFLCPCTSCFWMVIGLAAFIAFAFSLLPTVLPNGEKHLDQLFLQNGSAFDPAFKCAGNRAGYGAYPVCNLMQWHGGVRAKGTDLQALDILTFAVAIYYDRPEDIEAVVGNATINTELWPAMLESVEDVREVARLGVFNLPQLKTRILAIRGSSQAADWLLNADVWAPAVMLSIAQMLMLLGSLFPLSFGRRVLAPDIRELLGLAPPWESVRDRIRAARDQCEHEGYALYITGHSLGGGMAQLLGSLEGIQTLAFSPVGASVTLTRVTHDFIRQEVPIESTVVSVIPWGDVVPALDEQEGMVQRIACKSRNPITCHSLIQTGCELYRKCGDPRGRSMEHLCTGEVGSDWRQIPWDRFAWYS